MLKHFGSKVRKFRESQQVTREEFCGDESELSVRQLARIEAGESVPNLSKAHYIARNLGVSLDSLTAGASLELSKKYKELKYLILRTPTYNDTDRLDLIEKYLDEIYLNFYDDLPEDEKIAIESIQSSLDIYISKSHHFGDDLIREYMNQIKRKKIYSINDLLIIKLWQYKITASRYDPNIFKIDTFIGTIDKLLNQVKVLSIENLFLLRNVLIYSLGILFILAEYQQIENIINTLNDILIKTQDFQKRPIIDMFEWKYQLFYKENREVAKRKYQESTLFAQLIGDQVLVTQLKEEWKADYIE
ncbi:XRE family transcriptional regulator [Streptococcus agalactiae]|uniref:XRE family transcriptional regulator n=1 Tax=Streptococcus agalactiae TaxID=1311 RepID=UPI00178C7B72|nr:XRE family transcriptional regulator [Streptococcus agalactiae]